jgi:hypothetical protein
MHAKGIFDTPAFLQTISPISRPGISPRDLVDLGYFGFDKK